MKAVHTVAISVFTMPGDKTDNSQIARVIDNALKELVDLDFGKEKLAIRITKVEGFNNRMIDIRELTLTKEAHTNHFLAHLLSKLDSNQKSLLAEQSESRLDEELNFYIRLGKPELLRGEYCITESGDCFHIKMHIAAFQKKRGAALDVVEKIFGKNNKKNQ